MTARIAAVLCAAGLLAIEPAGDAQVVTTYRIETPAPGNPAARFSSAELAVLEKINRADRNHLARLPQLAVPTLWADDERAYSQMPPRYEAASKTARLVVVHVPGQMFGAYEFGQLVRWGPISSGAAATATPAGAYHLTWRAVSHVSTVNPDWILPWYFNFANEEGRAFHAYELPGRPASHGCIRLLDRDARWLFEWGREWRLEAGGTKVVATGTPVLIIGAFQFGVAPPWHSEGWLTRTVTLPPSTTGH